MATKTAYQQKLLDPRWQKKRLEILSRDNWTCKCCGDSESTLHIHHLSYKDFNNPWNIDSSFLITTCDSCHFIISNLAKTDFILKRIIKTPLLNQNADMYEAYSVNNGHHTISFYSKRAGENIKVEFSISKPALCRYLDVISELEFQDESLNVYHI